MKKNYKQYNVIKASDLKSGKSKVNLKHIEFYFSEGNTAALVNGDYIGGKESPVDTLELSITDLIKSAKKSLKREELIQIMYLTLMIMIICILLGVSK